jgi:hypothetical protein
MRRILVLALAGLVLGMGGCKKEEAAESGAAATADFASAAASRSAAPQALAAAGAGPKAAAVPAENRAPAIPRKLIRTVDLRLEVKDSAAVAKGIEDLVTRAGGYVSSVNAQRSGDNLEYSLTVRVPVDGFDPVLNAVRAFGVRVDREQQKVEDVTSQYIDLDARRRTLDATEVELRGLLAEARQRGRKVGEIMEIYKQLIDIRSQIEQIQTELSSYDKLAAFSTLNLELVSAEAAKPLSDRSWHPSENLRASVRTLVGFLQWLVDALVYTLVVLLPVGLVIAAILLLFLWLRRRVRRFTGEEPPQPPPTGASPFSPPPGGSARGN